MKDFQHLIRMAVIFAAAIAAFLVIRHFVVPPSFGKIGHYRADAVDEIKVLPVRYAGEAACKPCHPEQAREKGAGPHRSISCESCHGPARAHADVPKAARPSRPKEADVRAYCGGCHERNISRPRAFPQINLTEHNPGAPCILCHPPHRPK